MSEVAKILSDVETLKALLAEDLQPPDWWRAQVGQPAGKLPEWIVNAYRAEKIAELFERPGPYKPIIETLNWRDEAKDLFFQLIENRHSLSQPDGRRQVRKTIVAFLSNVRRKVTPAKTRGAPSQAERNEVWLKEWEAEPRPCESMAAMARAKRVEPGTFRKALASARKNRQERKIPPR